MRILRIITRLNNGGPAKQAIWLTAAFNKKSMESHLAAGKTGEKEDDIFWFAGQYKVRPLYIKHLIRDPDLFKDLRAFISLYLLMVKIKPDLVHTHMAKAGMLGRGAAVLYNLLHPGRIRIVHTYHGHVFHSYFSRLKTKLFIFLEKILAFKSDSLIAISNRLRDEINKKYRVGSREQFRVVPLGVTYTPCPTKKEGEAVVILGMMGRIAPIKNYGLAVDIARELKQRGIPAVIQVAGGGGRKELSMLKRRVQGEDLGKHIKFLGNIMDPAVFWNKVDIALITSKNEGTPVSLIEAMLSGIPFVAPYIGGIPDMTGRLIGKIGRNESALHYDNCILVKKLNAAEMTEALAYYIHNPDKREEAGNRGKGLAEGKYRLERLVRDLEYEYRLTCE